MDWALAIDRNREALLRVLGLLHVLAGFAPGQSVATISRQVHLSVLRLLRPAESAARRLIVIAARGLIAPPCPVRLASESIVAGKNRSSLRAAVFPLFDARLRLSQRAVRPVAIGPRISAPGYCDAVFTAEPQAPLPQTPVSADGLCRRLQALARVLNDLPAQAKRLARWRRRRLHLRPMRPGRPPGHRARPIHEVDTLLADCHALALHALAPP